MFPGVDIDTYLSQILKASPAPTTLGLNIYPELGPPNVSNLQYSVYQVVSSPPIYTQDGDPEGTRVWLYQFRQFGPSYFATRRDTKSLRDFLVGYRDHGKPGIQAVIKENEMGLPASGTGRLFCRMVQLRIWENLV